MYPKFFLEYFREFERSNEVFVAMPFGKECESRWESIFHPAIEAVGLVPYRVTESQISDSILTDIIAGIGRAKFIIADISFQKTLDRPAGPNVNVMYELGIAHAIRLPEEVIVVRGDVETKDTPFDILHIRYTHFDPVQTEQAKNQILELLENAGKALDLTRDLLVQRTLRSLDSDMMYFLGTIRSETTFDLYPFDLDRKGLYSLGYRESSEQELRAIARMLIELGILKVGDPGHPCTRVYGGTPEYIITPLGKAVATKLPSWCINTST